MKRIVSFFLVLALALGMVGFASAETLPSDIRNQIGKNDVVLSSAQLGTSDGTCWFIIARTWSNKNVLYMFKQFKGSSFYRKILENENILPDETNLALQLKTSETDVWTKDEFTGPVLDIDYLNTAADPILHMVFQFNGDSDSDWNLIRIWDSSRKYISAEFDKTRVYEYSDYKSSTVKSAYELKVYRSLGEAKLSDFLANGGQYQSEEPTKKPPAYSATPVELPYSSELYPDNGVAFAENKRYAVYSGPSEESIRGANNRAVVSTNDWIQVFGVEGNWVLVNYGIGKNHYRFGYIKKESLPSNYVAKQLEWLNMQATLLTDVSVTDDPFYSRSELTTIAAGTQVIWLATIGDWAYIESGNFRGFIPLTTLGVSRDSVPEGDNG